LSSEVDEIVPGRRRKFTENDDDAIRAHVAEQGGVIGHFGELARGLDRSAGATLYNRACLLRERGELDEERPTQRRKFTASEDDAILAQIDESSCFGSFRVLADSFHRREGSVYKRACLLLGRGEVEGSASDDSTSEAVSESEPGRVITASEDEANHAHIGESSISDSVACEVRGGDVTATEEGDVPRSSAVEIEQSVDQTLLGSGQPRICSGGDSVWGAASAPRSGGRWG
jgi:hypothetical protein